MNPLSVFFTSMILIGSQENPKKGDPKNPGNGKISDRILNVPKLQFNHLYPSNTRPNEGYEIYQNNGNSQTNHRNTTDWWANEDWQKMCYS